MGGEWLILIFGDQSVQICDRFVSWKTNPDSLGPILENSEKLVQTATDASYNWDCSVLCLRNPLQGRPLVRLPGWVHELPTHASRLLRTRCLLSNTYP